MAESTNDIFRRNHCKTPEWIADLEFFSLKFLPHIVFTKSSGYQFSVYKFSSSRVINPLLTKLARDRTRRISALGLFSLFFPPFFPSSVFSPRSFFPLPSVCQDLGPMFSQYGPRAWLIRYRYLLFSTFILMQGPISL